MQPKFACTATIARREIVTDDDRPDLSGANTFAGATVPPPGVASPSGQSLSGGPTGSGTCPGRLPGG